MRILNNPPSSSIVTNNRTAYYLANTGITSKPIQAIESSTDTARELVNLR